MGSCCGVVFPDVRPRDTHTFETVSPRPARYCWAGIYGSTRHPRPRPGGAGHLRPSLAPLSLTGSPQNLSSPLSLLCTIYGFNLGL